MRLRWFGVFFLITSLSGDFRSSQTHCEATHHGEDLRSGNSRENSRRTWGRLNWPVSVGNPRSCGHLIPQQLLRMTLVEERDLGRRVIRTAPFDPSPDPLESGVVAGPSASAGTSPILTFDPGPLSRPLSAVRHSIHLNAETCLTSIWRTGRMRPRAGSGRSLHQLGGSTRAAADRATGGLEGDGIDAGS